MLLRNVKGDRRSNWSLKENKKIHISNYISQIKQNFKQIKNESGSLATLQVKENPYSDIPDVLFQFFFCKGR